MKTPNYKKGFLAIRRLMLPLSIAVFGSQAVLASDFDWGNKCKTDTGSTIDVRGKLLGSKSTVKFDTQTVTAVVNNNTGKKQKVTLVTYKEFYEHSNFDDVYDKQKNLIKRGQDVFDYKTVMVPRGESTLTVDMPGCSTQIDLVCTDKIDYLGGGNLYGERKLAWYHAHQPDNGWCDDGIKPPPQVCELSIADVTGISDGQVVVQGTTLNIGASINGTPKKVRFELMDENGNRVEKVDRYSGQEATFKTKKLSEGQYTMKVSVYDNKGWNKSPKVPCDIQTISFTIEGIEENGNPNISCPKGTELMAKFEWKKKKNSYVFEKPTGNEGVISISGNAKNGSWNTTSASISHVILKGGTKTYTYEYEPEVTEGAFSKEDLPKNKGGKRPNISNIQFCGSEAPCQPEYYAVHDDRLNDSQILIVAEELEPVGGVHEGRDIEALAIHPKTGVLYAASGDDTDKPGYLYTIDKTNGELTEICDVTDYDEIDGLAFHPDGTLWGWVQGVGIITIDTADCTTTVENEHSGEVEDLTWNVAGTTLYAVQNRHAGSVDTYDSGSDNKGIVLLSYTPSGGIVELCENSSSKEIESLETLPDDTLMAGFHGKNVVIAGEIDTENCTITTIREIPTIFNDVEGIAGTTCR
ncbi:hypothetical protein QUF54_02050 [Candidatus Marithioploca araucensis]|uniref:Uncharacterized protein n=1 Tax=Candidatus Marithioploca araucensis TaxID=70273 RepID=A0ABT7VR15_9GAMM|nr:hypothetical protein [Candidatus Marithioploca araucensis]